MPDVADFIIVDGGKTGATNRALNHVAPSCAVVVDPFGQPRRVASENHPFDLDSEGMFPQTVSEVIQASRSVGSAVTLLPVGFLEAGARAVLRAIHSAANALDDTDVVLRMPLHTRWFASADANLLIAVLNDLPMPVVLCPGGDPRDPLTSRASIDGVVRITRECNDAQLWRTDLAGLGAFAYGARGFAIGLGSSQRHSLAPGQTGHRNANTDRRPSRLVEELLRWRTAANLDTSETLYTCEECCNGEPLKALSDDEARLHNLRAARRLFDELTGAEESQRPIVYRSMLLRARAAHDNDPSLRLSPQLAAWLQAFEGGQVAGYAS